jgi:hypothetical protein
MIHGMLLMIIMVSLLFVSGFFAFVSLRLRVLHFFVRLHSPHKRVHTLLISALNKHRTQPLLLALCVAHLTQQMMLYKSEPPYVKDRDEGREKKNISKYTP